MWKKCVVEFVALPERRGLPGKAEAIGFLVKFTHVCHLSIYVVWLCFKALPQGCASSGERPGALSSGALTGCTTSLLCSGATGLAVEHVIHTVGPIYLSPEVSAPLLASAYR